MIPYIPQDGSEFAQMVLADWLEEQGDPLAASCREGEEAAPWNYEYRSVGGVGVGGSVGVSGGSVVGGGGGVGVGGGGSVGGVGGY